MAFVVTHQSHQNESIINIKAPPECTLRNESSQDRQSGSDQEDPGNNIDERADIRATSRLARERVVRRNKERWRHHRIVSVVIRVCTSKSNANRQTKQKNSAAVGNSQQGTMESTRSRMHGEKGASQKGCSRNQAACTYGQRAFQRAYPSNRGIVPNITR